MMATAMSDVCEHDMGDFEGSAFDHTIRELIINIADVWEILRVRDYDPDALNNPDTLQAVRWHIEDKRIQLRDPGVA